MLGLDVMKILGLGVIGLGFLLALLAYRLLGKIQLQPNPNRSVLRSIYFFMGFSIVLCGIGFASQVFEQRRSQEQSEEKLKKCTVLVDSRELLSKVSGKIEEPIHGSPLSNTFQSAGTLVGFKEDEGVHIWLAVEVNGKIWPKEKELQVDMNGKWSTNVYEDGSGSKFSLILIAADEVAHTKILAWLDSGKRDGSRYETMYAIEGIVRLDRIDDLRLKDKP
jgi:hypothetical protein